MKKFLLLTLGAMALQTQAATITWGLGGDVYLMKPGDSYTAAVLANNEAAPEVAAGSYLALVYVGKEVDSFDINDISDDSVVASADFDYDASYPPYVDYNPPQIDTITTRYDDNSSFGIVWFNGSSFDYVYCVDDGAALNQTITCSDMSDRGGGAIFSMDFASGAGAGGVLVVPEPSVALLGLLGLGILIKRRRA